MLLLLFRRHFADFVFADAADATISPLIAARFDCFSIIVILLMPPFLS